MAVKYRLIVWEATFGCCQMCWLLLYF